MSRASSEARELGWFRMETSMMEFPAGTGTYYLSPFKDILRLKFGAPDADMLLVDTCYGPRWQYFHLTGPYGLQE
jgi:hypothetical protein